MQSPKLPRTFLLGQSAPTSPRLFANLIAFARSSLSRAPGLTPLPPLRYALRGVGETPARFA